MQVAEHRVVVNMTLQPEHAKNELAYRWPFFFSTATR